MQKVDWGEAKASIPILKVAHDLGYKKVHDKTSVNHVVLENSNGDRIKVVHPNEPRLQMYYNFNESGDFRGRRSGDNGSVIDFIKNRLNEFPQAQSKTEVGKINDVLISYKGSFFDYSTFCKEEGYRSVKPFVLDQYKHFPANTTDLRYLKNERGISQDTLSKFLPFIHIAPKEIGNRTYNNVAFPFTLPTDNLAGKSHIKGFEERNDKFKGFSEGGDKFNSIWEANFGSRINVKNVYLFESAIDAMSFYEINKNKIDLEKSAFISFGGTISQQQINNVLKAYPDANKKACFDNDMTGRFFDATVAAAARGDILRATIKKDGGIYFTYNDKPFNVKFESLPLLKDIGVIVGVNLKDQIGIEKPSIGKDWNEQLKNGQQIKTEKKNLVKPFPKR